MPSLSQMRGLSQMPGLSHWELPDESTQFVDLR